MAEIAKNLGTKLENNFNNWGLVHGRVESNQRYCDLLGKTKPINFDMLQQLLLFTSMSKDRNLL